MGCVEAELVLDDGGRVWAICVPILHLFLYYKAVLVDVGDESGRV